MKKCNLEQKKQIVIIFLLKILEASEEHYKESVMEELISSVRFSECKSSVEIVNKVFEEVKDFLSSSDLEKNKKFDNLINNLFDLSKKTICYEHYNEKFYVFNEKDLDSDSIKEFLDECKRDYYEEFS